MGGTRKDDVNDPSFIFLQLYSSRFLGDLTDVPILLPANEVCHILHIELKKECRLISQTSWKSETAN